MMVVSISSFLWAATTFLILFSAIYLLFYFKFTSLKMLNNVKYFNKKSIKLLNFSLAGKIGVGSISGIAISIIIGGRGTILWIWISSILLSIFTYLETKCGIIFREKMNNTFIGGPFIYIDKVLHKKRLSFIYSLLIIYNFLFAFVLIQSNTIIISISNTFLITKEYVIILLIIVTIISINKGIKRISNIVSVLVPVMGLIYLIIGIYVCINNINMIPYIINDIFKSAFTFKSFITLPFIIGFQRAVFSNETGIGSTSMVVALSNGKDYKQEYFFQALGMYYITLIICTISALIILTSNYDFVNCININGIEIVNYSFNYHFGIYGPFISTIIISLFAYSTIITSFYYGNLSINYLFNNKKNTIVKIIVIIIIVMSGYINPLNIWAIVDISTALLTLINIFSLIKIRAYLKDDD